MGDILFRSVWENTMAKVENVAGALGCCNCVMNALRDEVFGGKQHSRVQITLQATPLLRPQSVVCFYKQYTHPCSTLNTGCRPSLMLPDSQISTVVRPAQHSKQQSQGWPPPHPYSWA